MKNQNIKLFVALLPFLVLSACKKELNVYPTTSEVDGKVITDQQSAFTVLNGIYYRFADVSVDRNNVPSVEWSDVNEALPSTLSGTLSNSSQPWNPSGFTPSTYGTDFQWVYGYNIVNAANGFLKNIAPVTTIPSATKEEMIAEAKFLRAFGNTQLLLYYGQYYNANSKYGIILRDQFVTSANINLPRSTVSQCYSAILNDLDSAIAYLPSLNSQIYYANVWAAKLLKARLLINRGAQGDYTEVINLTQDIISNGPFSLEDSTKDIFLSDGFSSKEVILGIQPFPNETYKFKNNQYYYQYPGTPELDTLLANDPRNQWVYQVVNYYGTPTDEFTKYYSGDPNNPIQTPLSEYSYAFRLTEAYLLQAEAITLSGGDLTMAKSLLNTVRDHAGFTT
ncbi:MAG: RagB/SusD family nutrient uptake outer membrane protein, partial [Chitinophagaceae bacterium]